MFHMPEKGFSLGMTCFGSCKIEWSSICITYECVELCMDGDIDSSDQLELVGTRGPGLGVEDVEIVLARVGLSWIIYE